MINNYIFIMDLVLIGFQVVTSCVENGPAARAGIHEGDELIEINGMFEFLILIIMRPQLALVLTAPPIMFLCVHVYIIILEIVSVVKLLL